MKFDFKLIVDKEELLDYKEKILKLFQDCFGKSLDERIWLWAYANNSFGSPIVSLCLDGSRLVGHYAVIPIAMKKNDVPLKTCLSMTTMVEVHYRKQGLFYEQAQEVYRMAEKMGFQIVVGFPNEKSLPGFKKRLGWECGAPDYVALLTKEQLLSRKSYSSYLSDNDMVKLDMEDRGFSEWRLSKPQTNYYVKNNYIIKDFEPHKDLVFINEEYVESLDENNKFNILIDASIDDFREHTVFEYQFGYKCLSHSLENLRFKKDLLISDVF